MSVQLDSAVGERLKFGEFELAPDARSLWRHGEEIRLGSRALDILIALATRPGQIVSKDDLTQMVWRGAFVDETALRVGISAVRKALGNGGDRYIATVPGRGYCFVRDVETTAVKPTAAPPHFERLKPQRLPTQIARVFGRDEIIATLGSGSDSAPPAVVGRRWRHRQDHCCAGVSAKIRQLLQGSRAFRRSGFARRSSTGPHGGCIDIRIPDPLAGSSCRAGCPASGQGGLARARQLRAFD